MTTLERDETADQVLVLGPLHRTTLQRDRFAAALRKIVAWKGYDPAPQWFDSDVPLTDYERGANDMLETLRQFAKDALA